MNDGSSCSLLMLQLWDISKTAMALPMILPVETALIIHSFIKAYRYETIRNNRWATWNWVSDWLRRGWIWDFWHPSMRSIASLMKKFKIAAHWSRREWRYVDSLDRQIRKRLQAWKDAQRAPEVWKVSAQSKCCCPAEPAALRERVWCQHLGNQHSEVNIYDEAALPGCAFRNGKKFCLKTDIKQMIIEAGKITTGAAIIEGGTKTNNQINKEKLCLFFKNHPAEMSKGESRNHWINRAGSKHKTVATSMIEEAGGKLYKGDRYINLKWESHRRTIQKRVVSKFESLWRKRFGRRQR